MNLPRHVHTHIDRMIPTVHVSTCKVGDCVKYMYIYRLQQIQLSHRIVREREVYTCSYYVHVYVYVYVHVYCCIVAHCNCVVSGLVVLCLHRLAYKS